MHAAYARTTDFGHDAVWHAQIPERPSSPPPPVVPALGQPATERAVYGTRNGPNWIAILGIVALHALVLGALLSYRAVYLKPALKPPLVVELLSLPKPPPPRPVAATPVETPPQAQPVRVSEVIAPKPLVDVPAPAAPVVAAPPPPAPKSNVPAAPVVAAAPVAPAAPVSVSDLSSKMIAGKPPKYPVESRRKREQGTVVLAVLVGTDGAVAEVNLSRSSGFARLDKAALEAVRRWRWSPTLREGQPVLVRGYVDIPFVLAG